MATVLKTRSEQRLEQLEALQRSLTRGEDNELRKCLHAIYMRHWRLERGGMGAGGELLEAQKRGRVEVNAIAYRMNATRDEDWPIPHADDWQEHARIASNQLRDAILSSQARAREMAAA